MVCLAMTIHTIVTTYNDVHMIQPSFPIISQFVAYKIVSIVAKDLYSLDEEGRTQDRILTDLNLT